MKSAHNHPNEIARLKSLEEHQLLDSLPEEVYDDITRLASQISGTPVALLNLIGENRQWTKSQHGMEVGDVPRENSFCAHTIINLDKPLVINDARYDDRFHDNPMTVGKPPVIFYAGVPVNDENGLPLGSLCVVDHRPRELSEDKVMSLQALAKLINTHFELRKARLQLQATEKQLADARALATTINTQLLNTPLQGEVLQGLTANMHTLLSILQQK